MMNLPICRSRNLQPASRDDLAAAGPVEPSASFSVLAPGPTFSLRKPGASLVARNREVRRRRFAAALRASRLLETGEMPTLAFVPGIAITGRYRMQPPFDPRTSPPRASKRRYP
jgi:hypothetical protein